MQEPTEEAGDSISTTENHEREDPDLNRTFAVRRKAAKRTLPWDLVGEELNLVSRRQESEDIRAATKKPRLEEPFSASPDEVATNISNDTAVSLSTTDSNEADADPEKGGRATGFWTPEEDAKLKCAVMNTCKKKWGSEYKIDWAAVAALVPGRTARQCKTKWKNDLDPSIDRATNARKGKWAEDEDIELKYAAQTHGGKNWDAIASLVPGRSQRQCYKRWKNVLDPNLDRANERTGKWTAIEDSKLKDAVYTHGGKNWGAIAAQVPDRTTIRCHNRWYQVLDPSIVRTNERTGKWAEDENSKLKDAVQLHGGKNWNAIAALVPGRSRIQCQSRWKDISNPNIDRASARTCKWAEDEDTKLTDAVQRHGGKNWDAIAALVLGRTKRQCNRRWKDVLDPRIALTAGRTGIWAAVEDSKLKDAVRRHGGKNWDEITALVPSRTPKQCRNRWQFLRRSLKRE
jgi:hypothetical protein